MERKLLLGLLFLLVSTNLFGLKRDYSQWGDYCCPSCEYVIWTDEHEGEDAARQKLPRLINIIPYMHLYSEDEEEAQELDEQGEDHTLYLHCCYCYGEGVCYHGYFDLHFQKYFDHFLEQLEHCFTYCDCYSPKKHLCCECYWPELSFEAAAISDKAYTLFSNLFKRTKLISLRSNFAEQKELLGFKVWPTGHPMNDRIRQLTLHELTISCIAHQFLFSDYYLVCHDIRNYARSKYPYREYVQISDRLDYIQTTLYQLFYSHHSSCLKKHPTDRIMQEIEFMNYLKGNIWEFPSFEKTLNFGFQTRNHFSGVADDLENIKNSNLEILSRNYNGDLCLNKLSDVGYSKKNIKGSKKYVGRSKTQQHKYIQRDSLFLLEQGVILNQLLLHKEAVEKLSKAILVDPNNQEAYLERAIAYFETNQIDLALKDYKKVKKLDVTHPFKFAKRKINLRSFYLPDNNIEFSKGFLKGCMKGANLSLIELLPSLFSSCRGILNGLWAFTCSPIEVSMDMINTAYEIGDFISKNSTLECLQCVVPELKEVSLFWNEWNDKKKGKKIGFIIGKYGTDIFAPIVAIKGISKLQAIRRANTMLTLECCVSSEMKRTIILQESIKRANARAGILQTTKKGKIFVKSSNVKYHVMQEKHAWGKLIKLSGNVEEDFAKVIAFIEENEIMQRKYLRECVGFPRDAVTKNIYLSEYRAVFGEHEIQVFFEQYVDTGEIFLKNGWVINK